jgi:hypothetical protein
MIPQRSQSGADTANDVRYGIAACRRRLRNERATHRTRQQNKMDAAGGESKVSVAPDVESYAEILAKVSMSQSSIARLVECLLEPTDGIESVSDELGDREEAAIT